MMFWFDKTVVSSKCPVDSLHTDVLVGMFKKSGILASSFSIIIILIKLLNAD